VLAAAQAAQAELADANAALRAERDAAVAADRHAAADAAARVQQLEAEREALLAARDAAQQVGEGGSAECLPRRLIQSPLQPLCLAALSGLSSCRLILPCLPPSP
jgi:hypothetical protein